MRGRCRARAVRKRGNACAAPEHLEFEGESEGDTPAQRKDRTHDPETGERHCERNGNNDAGEQ